MTELSTDSSSTRLEPIVEKHRPIVRETDKKMANTYGFGGAGVLGAAVGAFAILKLTGLLGWVAAIVVSITVGLIGLFVLRTVVNRRRRTLRRSFEQYCELNDVDADTLHAYFLQEDIYPFFLALYETRES